MKLTEIANDDDYPVVIGLVNNLVKKDIPVYFTLVGDKNRYGQSRVTSISRSSVYDPSVDLSRHAVFYVGHDQDPQDTWLARGEVNVPQQLLHRAELKKQKDGAWLLDIPRRLIDEAVGDVNTELTTLG